MCEAVSPVETGLLWPGLGHQPLSCPLYSAIISKSLPLPVAQFKFFQTDSPSPSGTYKIGNGSLREMIYLILPSVNAEAGNRILYKAALPLYQEWWGLTFLRPSWRNSNFIQKSIQTCSSFILPCCKGNSRALWGHHQAGFLDLHPRPVVRTVDVFQHVEIMGHRITAETFYLPLHQKFPQVTTYLF